MKKLILFVFIISFFNFNAYSENLFTDLEIKLINEQNDQQKVCEYKKILNETPPCTSLKLLKETLNNPYIKYLPRPDNINIEDYKKLIKQKIDKHPEQIKYLQEVRQNEKQNADLHCSVLGGQANNWLSSRKIYKSCMKSKGF